MSRLEAAMREAIEILLSDARPTHDAVILLRTALGEDAFGNPKQATFPAGEIGISLQDDHPAEPITKMPKIDPGPWR